MIVRSVWRNVKSQPRRMLAKSFARPIEPSSCPTGLHSTTERLIAPDLGRLTEARDLSDRMAAAERIDSFANGLLACADRDDGIAVCRACALQAKLRAAVANAALRGMTALAARD